jgi:putative transposase
MGRPAGQEGVDMILQIRRGLREDGFTVPMTQLCRRFDVPRRTVYYKPVKSKPKVQDRFATPIKQDGTLVWLSDGGKPYAPQ